MFDSLSFKKKPFYIFTNRRSLHGSSGFGTNKYVFIHKKDTMKATFFCRQNINYYIKNLKFKKGEYQLKFTFPRKYNSKTKKYELHKKYAFGNEVKTSKEVQSALFKNADYEQLRTPKYKDLYFKDMKFIVIDLKDTLNVKFKKIENEKFKRW